MPPPLFAGVPPGGRAAFLKVRFKPEDLDTVRAALAASTLKPGEYAFYGVTGSGGALRAERLP